MRSFCKAQDGKLAQRPGQAVATEPLTLLLCLEDQPEFLLGQAGEGEGVQGGRRRRLQGGFELVDEVAPATVAPMNPDRGHYGWQSPRPKHAPNIRQRVVHLLQVRGPGGQLRELRV